MEPGAGVTPVSWRGAAALAEPKGPPGYEKLLCRCQRATGVVMLHPHTSSACTLACL